MGGWRNAQYDIPDIQPGAFCCQNGKIIDYKTKWCENGVLYFCNYDDSIGGGMRVRSSSLNCCFGDTLYKSDDKRCINGNYMYCDGMEDRWLSGDFALPTNAYCDGDSLKYYQDSSSYDSYGSGSGSWYGSGSGSGSGW